MEVKPGYKPTEVGVIPEEWDVRSIGQLFRLVNGCPFKPVDWKQSGTPIIRIQNLNDPSAAFNFSQTPVPERNRVEPGDLLFAWSGTIGSSFGARVWAGPAGVLNQHIFKVHLDDEKITQAFSLLVFARVETDIAKQAHGFKASFVHVKKSDLVKVQLPVPPLPEQRAIAEVLGNMDTLESALDWLIAKKRYIKKAAMQQFLTGQTRLPGFTDEWREKRLGELGQISGSGIDKKILPGELPIRLVNYMDVHRRDHLRSSDLVHWVSASPAQAKRCVVKKGDVFFTPSSETRNDIANSSVALEDIEGAGYSYHVVRFRLSEPWDLRFRVLAFKTRAFLTQAETQCDGSGTRYVISLRKFRGLVVRVPPLPEQAAIGAILSDMGAELAALEARRDKTRLVKQGMMQKLLTGRTRLVHQTQGGACGISIV